MPIFRSQNSQINSSTRYKRLKKKFNYNFICENSDNAGDSWRNCDRWGRDRRVEIGWGGEQRDHRISDDLHRKGGRWRRIKCEMVFFFSFFFLFPFFILLLSCPFITNFEIIGGRFFVISNGYIWLCGAMMKLPFHPFHNLILWMYIYTFRKYMIHHLS